MPFPRPITSSILACLVLLPVITLAPPVSLHLPQDDDLAWVMPDSRRITSNFCESRGRRYHAGIDLGTAGAVGLPVLSPVDGWVHKVYTSFWGYGKQLVVMSESGRQYLFAHLQEFRDDIEEEVLRRQQESGTYFQDFTLPPDQFRVRRGQRIAGSGDTGIGPPHLHMEIRQGDSWALNPFSHGLEVPDKRSPVFQELALLPAEPGVTVQGSLLPAVVSITQEKGRYRPNARLTVDGPFRLALRAIDRVDGSESRLAPYRIRLLSARDTLYDCTYDAFPFALNHQMLGEVNRWLTLQQGQTFRNLWPTPGELPFARPLRTLHNEPVEHNGPPEWPGVIRWPNPDRPDSLSLTLELEDAAGNSSRMGFVIHHRPSTAASGRARTLPDGLRPDESWRKALFHWNGEGASLRLSVPKADSLLVITDGGITVWPLGGKGKNRQEGFFRLDPNATTLQLAYRAAAGDWRSGPRWMLTRPGVGHTGLTRFRAGDGSTMTLGWDNDSFVEPQVVLVESQDGDWTIGPPELRIIEELRLELPRPVDGIATERAEQTALYRRSDKSLAWAGNDSTATGLAGTVTWPGRYTLAADTTAPRITVAGSWAGKGQASPLFQFGAGDNLSGIADVQMWLDRVRVFARLDPEAGRVLYKPRSPLPRGEHSLRLRVIDSCGNAREWNGTHTVK